ncbi:hypothetical protein LJU02_06630 [Corynebacterium pseudotuberculosis]|uniref:ABC transporter permease n=1 Tax=Corynebacterium pseudotuberculosis 258 TaxID=1168865 RepID=A0AAU8PKR7_CORPS|nr:hypothetical protein [Corynebacterium pseudotuberculosis]AEQ06850.1 hypothetical protein CPCIP5297_06720 [Corynebacterium pseudotuberculosis CIP 52.97]AFB72651.1 hypothetical protein CP316_06705 [Corynebacterium pseudotuberculosis 316]AFH91120.1 hypothetical protein CP31_06935 [Corynebacterium pseudotuberculosis 31]AFK16944.2 hypothetical protein CP258_06720 [Corynebacterium pseudotuberculosis 258]AMN70917.1 hypothetical protein ATN02_07045 [Corynebacterium pseudotuberculosis]
MSLYDRKAAILHSQTPSQWSTAQVRRLRCAVISMSTAICIALATLASSTMRDNHVTAIALAMSMAMGAAAALATLVSTLGLPYAIRHSLSRKSRHLLSSFLVAVPSFVVLATGMLSAFDRFFPSALYAPLNIILVTIAMPSAGIAIFIGSLFFFPQRLRWVSTVLVLLPLLNAWLSISGKFSAIAEYSVFLSLAPVLIALTALIASIVRLLRIALRNLSVLLLLTAAAILATVQFIFCMHIIAGAPLNANLITLTYAGCCLLSIMSAMLLPSYRVRIKNNAAAHLPVRKSSASHGVTAAAATDSHQEIRAA